ncbi:MAG: hypothetical protein OIN87_07830 [Candidatus Methanoperedens sp.]|nr:hypothetical protein [Candidatus Methanoperedens sp.]
MKSWIMGLLFVCLLVAGGIFFSSGFVGGNSASAEQVGEIPQSNLGSPNVIQDQVDTLTLASLPDGKASPDDKVSASASTCTIKNGEYVIDLRIKNPGIETRAITITPSGTKMDILANTTYRYDLNLPAEVPMLYISVDDGTELQVRSPNCSTGGWSGSGSGVSGFSIQEQEQNPSGPSVPTEPLQPTPPVPELSGLVLTLAGISGLMILSKIRKE